MPLTWDLDFWSISPRDDALVLTKSLRSMFCFPKWPRESSNFPRWQHSRTIIQKSRLCETVVVWPWRNITGAGGSGNSRHQCSHSSGGRKSDPVSVGLDSPEPSPRLRKGLRVSFQLCPCTIFSPHGPGVSLWALISSSCRVSGTCTRVPPNSLLLKLHHLHMPPLHRQSHSEVLEVGASPY